MAGRKRKLSGQDEPAAKKPKLTTSYTRTDPETGKLGRVRKKDSEYMEIFNSSPRAKRIKRLRDKRRKKELDKKRKEKERKKREREQRRLNREKNKNKKEQKDDDDEDEDDDISSDEEEEEDVKKDDKTSKSVAPFHHFTKRFEDHVIVITGGGRGIGQICALRLAQEGGIIYILDNTRWKDSVDLISSAQEEFFNNNWDLQQAKRLYNDSKKKRRKKKPKAPQKVFNIKCDVTDEVAVREAIKEIISERGFIDVVLNCVNTTGNEYLNKRSHEVTLKEFERVIKSNVYSCVAVINAVIPFMKKESYGRIINLAAADGKCGTPKCLSYSCAKAAVISLTKTYGKEYAGTGITVNCIAPEYDDYHVKKLADKGHKWAKEAANNVPMGRPIEMDELAGCVAFIASEENTYTTGFCYDLTGGTGTY